MSKLEWVILALFALLAYTVNQALADDIYAKMGTSAKKEASSKVFGLGIQGQFTSKFIYQLEQDFLSIPSDVHPLTLNGSARLGVRVDLDSIYATATTGPGYISQRDSYLGGYFQFVEDVSVGIKDKTGSLFGVGYQHISSAGIELPNRGRDYLYFKVGVTF